MPTIALNMRGTLVKESSGRSIQGLVMPLMGAVVGRCFLAVFGTPE